MLKKIIALSLISVAGATDQAMSHFPWDALPLELKTMVVTHLPTGDLAVFRLVEAESKVLATAE